MSEEVFDSDGPWAVAVSSGSPGYVSGEYWLKTKNEQRQPQPDDTEYLAAMKRPPQSLWATADDRHALVMKFSWAIPNTAALHAIRDLQEPILEVGAGTGYWAYELRKLNVNITPTGVDVRYDQEGSWLNVEYLNAMRSIRKYRDCNLLMCWPCYRSSWSSRALWSWLNKSRRKFFIYVGEGPGGCTGDDKLHELIHQRLKVHRRVQIPQYYGLHDELVIYKRK